MDYLNFRIQSDVTFPSIADGLNQLEEICMLISPGYFRIRPSFYMEQVANYWGSNWQDASQYGYVPYANKKREKNAVEFTAKYRAFLMQHGSSNDV